MADPIVFVSHFTVKEGRLDALTAYARDAAAALEHDKPRTLLFLPFVGASGTLSIVHVFGDAAAMDAHFEGAAGRAQRAYEFVTPTGWEIYGTPSDAALGAMREAAASAGVGLVHEPTPLAGFIRSAAG